MPNVGNLIVTMTADSAKFELSMQSARRRLKETQQAIQELQRGGLDRLAAGMTFATGQQARWQQLSTQGALNLQSLRRSTESTTGAVFRSAEGFKKAENAVIDMGLRVVGLEGKIGKLSEGLLVMGVGGAVTLGVTAGLALIGAAYHALTAEARKSAEEQQKIVDDLAGRFAGLQARLDPTRFAQTRIASLSTRTAALNRELASVRANPLQFFDRATGGTRTVERTAEIRALEAELVKLGQAAFVVGQEWQDAVAQGTTSTRQAATDPASEQWLANIRALTARHAELWATIRGRPKGILEEWAEGAERVRRVEEAALDARMEQYRLLSRGAAQTVTPARLELGGVETSLARDAARFGDATLKRVEQTAVARQQRMAKFTQEVWLSAARNIQSSLANTFESIFAGQVKSLGDFARSVVQIVERAIAQILAAQAAAGIAPIISGLVGAAAGGAGQVGNSTQSGGLLRAPALRAEGGSRTIVLSPTVNIAVSAIDASGVERFVRQARSLIGRQVLEAIRNDSGFASAMRG